MSFLSKYYGVYGGMDKIQGYIRSSRLLESEYRRTFDHITRVFYFDVSGGIGMSRVPYLAITDG